MPRGDRSKWGGARIATRPDAKKAGRPKALATVRIPIDATPALLDALIELHNGMDREHPAERGLVFLIAGLTSELPQAPRE